MSARGSKKRQRREAPPLSKQPFIFSCLVALVVHAGALGLLFFLHKENSRPVIDAALVYGSAKIDMTKVHWVETLPRDLVAEATGESPAGMNPEPESKAQPQPEPEPGPATTAAAIEPPRPSTPEPTVAVTTPESPPEIGRSSGDVRPMNPYGAGSSIDDAILSPNPDAGGDAGGAPSPMAGDSALPPSPSQVMRDYEINLLATFEKGWKTPHIDIGLQVRTEVIVGKDGRIIRSRIIQASNHFEMDQSVRRALDQVIRAEPLPDFVDTPTYKFILTFAIP